ncbi:C-C motif chemokine 19-like [Chelmon rostratus]|uniref:C-C motif chemokine 19-like n=1 Tax=Chelmon rostratus TaxID=109905 RepID=UPI001BEB4B83|nr:C-C motif chemokine 19-like [Chelmon rostratus]
MAQWGDAKLFLCILFFTCCTVTLAQMPMDCCLAVKNKTIDKYAIADYGRQINGQGCSLDATILVTRRDKKLCVPADELWVHEVVRHVDSLKRHCKKNKYKGRRCFGLRQE